MNRRMKQKNTSLTAQLLTLAVFFIFTACSDSTTGSGDTDPELETNQITDLNARGEDGHFTFFSLRNGNTVALSDSASANWDLAFKGTTILVNSGVSGPGEGGAILLDLPFEEVEMAPSEGYRTDSAEELAIPAGAGNGWYSYDFATHTIAPIEDKTIVICTGDGKHYAKVEIGHYYLGSPDMSSDEFMNNPELRESGYYTFRYTIQLEESVRDLTKN